MSSTPQHTIQTPSVWKTGLGFRPFFWLGSVFLLVALAVWWLFWHGKVVLAPQGGMLWWHQHEMMFGFVVAIVVGFLLTSVQNWTGLPSLSGWPLWALVGLWLAARVLLAFPMGMNAWVIATLDVLLLPLVALFMAYLITKAKKWHNLPICVVLLLLAFSNAAMHAGSINGDARLSSQSVFFAIWLVVCLIILIGGRVVPFFVHRGLGRPRVANPKGREIAIFLSAAALCVLQLLRVVAVPVAAEIFVIPLVALVVLNTWRLGTWELQHCWREPLLWGLHLSYAFVVIGSVMWILSEFAVLRVDLAVHALTVGAMMTIIFAMIARVGLGHTGRKIHALPGVGLAIVMLLAAGIIRSVWLIVFPEMILWSYSTSIILAMIAYALFVVYYTKVLWLPRPDGKAG